MAIIKVTKTWLAKTFNNREITCDKVIYHNDYNDIVNNVIELDGKHTNQCKESPG